MIVLGLSCACLVIVLGLPCDCLVLFRLALSCLALPSLTNTKDRDKGNYKAKKDEDKKARA